MKPYLLIALLLVACTQNKTGTIENKNASDTSVLAQTVVAPDTTVCNQKVSDAIGFLKMEETVSPFVLKDTVGNKSVRVDFNNLQIQNKFFPFAYHKDYHLLVFRCVDYKDENYKVVVDETTNRTMLLSDKNKKFKFQPWTEHILSSCCIDFDYRTNPLRENKSNTAKIIDLPNDEIFIPFKIDGDWLQVKWGNKKELKYGWILWKLNNCVLINIVYFT